MPTDLRLTSDDAEQRSPRSAPTPGGARVLIVDDDPIVAESLADHVGRMGYRTSVCFNAAEALAAIAEGDRGGAGSAINLVITDASMPSMSGQELLERIRAAHPEIVVVMLTGYATIESAVRAIQSGAFDYLSKPIVDSELRVTLERALAQQVLLAENLRLRSALDSRVGLAGIVTHNHRMRKSFEMIESVAPSKATILVTGESGTGKSMIARAIHHASPRAPKPFVELHCGSIPETLLESELFGHVKGAFTGAQADKQGRFLAAHGGTIFIDEINSASQAMQLKLLRVLQERRFEPVGSTETVEVDVRVILATNQPLEPMVAEGRFREDLYYRINVVKIELPPLRERIGDIPALVRHFIQKYNNEHGRATTGIDEEAMSAIQRYPFPGNVRELENVIERAVLLSRTTKVELADLPPYVARSDGSLTPAHVRAGLAADDAVDAPDTPWRATPLADALLEPERRIILKALRANEWNRQKTADDLEINRTTLYKKMKSLGLDEMSG